MTQKLWRRWLIVALSVTLTWAFSVSPVQANGAAFLESYRDPTNPQVIFAVFDTSSPAGVYLLQSRDGGRTWKKVLGPDGAPVDMGGRQDEWDFFFVRTGPPPQPRLVLTYRRADALWRAGPDLRWTAVRAPQNIEAVLPTAHPDVFFLIVRGTAQSEFMLYRTENGGGAWQKVHDKLPFTAIPWLGGLLASRDGKVLVGMGHISRDGGKSWAPIAPDRAAQEAAAITAAAVRDPWPIVGNPDQVKAAFRAIEGK